MLRNLIYQKQAETNPFGQMLATRPSFSEIWQIRSLNNTVPYTEYFQGGIGDEPVVFKRRAGWTPQFALQRPEFACEENVADSWCWQAPCNTVFTNYKEFKNCGECGEFGECKRKECIIMDR